jgi:hypothetical protein
MIYLFLFLATIALAAVIAFQAFIPPPTDYQRDAWPTRLQQGGGWGKRPTQDSPPEETQDDA